tara:strand:+ start:1064 stop:1387 length:324 start_codon:yes stop_codon:yes gene_type:complete
MATLAQWKKQLKASHSSLSKNVDGVTSTLSTAEYNKTIDEWAKASFDKEIATNIKENGGKSPNYAQYRVEAYPSIGDQLDMQYHDSVNGTTTWADAIAAVKAKYKKP